MRHGCRFELVLENITLSSRPSFSQSTLAGLEGLPTSEVHRLCLESFLRRRMLHRERRRAVDYLVLLLLLLPGVKSEDVMMKKKTAEYVVFHDREGFGKFFASLRNFD